jgi:hypothetical protein
VERAGNDSINAARGALGVLGTNVAMGAVGTLVVQRALAARAR